MHPIRQIGPRNGKFTRLLQAQQVVCIYASTSSKRPETGFWQWPCTLSVLLGDTASDTEPRELTFGLAASLVTQALSKIKTYQLRKLNAPQVISSKILLERFTKRPFEALSISCVKNTQTDT
jgi:hypothetical protein